MGSMTCCAYAMAAACRHRATREDARRTPYHVQRVRLDNHGACWQRSSVQHKRIAFSRWSRSPALFSETHTASGRRTHGRTESGIAGLHPSIVGVKNEGDCSGQPSVRCALCCHIYPEVLNRGTCGIRLCRLDGIGFPNATMRANIGRSFDSR